MKQAEDILIRYKIEIMGMSEVRWIDSGEHTTAEGNTFLYSCDPERRERGVGLLITKAVKKGLIEWSPVSDRLITARFRTKIRNVNVVQCYAPTNPSDAEEKDAFYDLLALTLGKIHKGEITILMGDLNAKVGSDNKDYEAIMGRHGLGARNDNGDRFVEFCQQNSLVIGGTIFPHKEVHKHTWRSNDRVTLNQIDHVCISKKWRHMLLDVRNRRGADIDSDHELVEAKIQLKIAGIRRQTQNRPRTHFDLIKLKDPNVKQLFSAKLREKMSSTAGMEWQQIYRDTAKEVLGEGRRGQRKQWISDRTLQLVRDRNRLKEELNRDPLRAYDRYREAAVKVKRSARGDKRTFLNNMAAEAQAAANRHDTRELYRKVRKIRSGNCPRTQPILGLNGNVLSAEHDQMNRWREHFEDLLNYEEEHTDDTPFVTAEPNRRIRVDPPR